ncbi:hypothetical protein NQ314_015292 [Rhamnusium bicolor]|uniref:Uncharacterized protein n=1 Tax=Rhamnusium bicolor TaxID=1586634 RepID=A0AAV8X019_9CUCU|nr:hypothetical protein NQ314_015292 [Rhamnusium bicolor]
MKVEEETSLKNHQGSFGYPAFPNPAMFTPSQLIMASQLMAASGLTISANPAFFHPGLLPMAWPANSPPSPPVSSEPLSPSLKSSRKVNNNNNVVSSSTTADVRKRKWKVEEEASVPLPSPTSSVSPPSGPEEMTPESDDHEEELRKRRMLHPPSTPLITLPLQVSLPEQTEPEDLSMSTGINSNSSSGGSPVRSPSSREDVEEEDYDPQESAAIFLQRRPLGHS